MSKEVKICAGTATMVLGKTIASSYGKSLANVNILRFSDGEFQPSFEETVRGADVFIIQSTTPPSDNLMELLQKIILRLGKL